MSDPISTPVMGKTRYAAFLDADVAGLPSVDGRFRVAASKGSRGRWTNESGLSGERFWEPNRGRVRMLTVDMDMPDSEVRLAAACAMGRVPLPDAYVVNVRKGTLQASWWLSPFPASVMARRSSATAWLYSRVLESLRLRLHGDPCFTDGRRRNPYCALGQRVMVSPHAGVRSLADMRSWLQARGAFDDGRRDRDRGRLVAAAWSVANGGEQADVKAPGPVRAGRGAVKGARNSTVFAAALAAARSGADPTAAARSVRCSPPLPDREIASVVRSAVRCASRPAPGAHTRRGRGKAGSIPSLARVCAGWGRKGGLAATDMQKRARERNLALGARSNSLRHAATRDRCLLWLRRYGEAGLRVLAAGGRPAAASVRAIARGLDVSRQTVSRCLAELAGMIGAGSVLQHGRNPMPNRSTGLVSALAYAIAGDGDRLGVRLRRAGLTLLDPGGPPPDPIDPSCAAALLMAAAPMMTAAA